MEASLGCIADDVTGASDLAIGLAQNGMSALMLSGVPQGRPLADTAALVVALKTRTVSAQQACEQSLAAARWLLEQGVRRLYFKYCSTFDSTDKGNIGPVIEVLMRFLEADLTLACPAFPSLRRTVYQGHLFVGDRLLSESSLRYHPLTPMRDADLVRVLQQQLADQQPGLLDLETVEAGAEAIRNRLEVLQERSRRIIVADAIFDRHLREIARASYQLPLLTGGSALAARLPACYRQAGELAPSARSGDLPRIDGPVAILAGSCAAATRRQVAALATEVSIISIDPLQLADGTVDADALFEAAGAGLRAGAVAFASSASPEEIEAVQGQLGRDRAAGIVEDAFGALATRLLANGVRKLIVAGGETSGAVLRALRHQQLWIGPEIEPGVPWCVSLAEPQVLICLKSGNFGSQRFFSRAIAALP